jgi:hypothetical protein
MSDLNQIYTFYLKLVPLLQGGELGSFSQAYPAGHGAEEGKLGSTLKASS